MVQTSRPMPAIEPKRAERVEPARVGVATLGQQPQTGEPGRSTTTGTLTQKTAPQEKCSQQQAAADRTERDGQAGHAGPDADGAGPLARGR